MALVEKVEIDKCEVLFDGTIQARTARIIERDGVEISRKYINRQVWHPGDDLIDAPDMVKKIAEVEHTDEAVKAYADFVKAAEERRIALEGG